jgi:hypothetical protein
LYKQKNTDIKSQKGTYPVFDQSKGTESHEYILEELPLS